MKKLIALFSVVLATGLMGFVISEFHRQELEPYFCCDVSVVAGANGGAVIETACSHSSMSDACDAAYAQAKKSAGLAP